MMINLNSINLGSINLGGMNTSEIKLGYPSSDSPVPGLKGLQGLYMGKGLTNEMMSRDPVWRDKSGKGNHIQLKNFAWAEKSGVGMYHQNFKRYGFGNLRQITYTVSSSKIDLEVPASVRENIYSDVSTVRPVGYVYDFRIKVTGIKDGCILKIGGLGSGSHTEITQDGIYSIKHTVEESWEQYRIYIWIENTNGPQMTLSIEQVPDYENALCFDGVDDYGICETFPVLTKEKGYTVMALRKWISREPRFVNLVTNVYSWNVNGAFILEYKEDNGSYASSFGWANAVNITAGALTYQTSESYNGVALKKGERIGTNTVLLSRSSLDGLQFYSSFALYALAIIDHDTTAEERQLVIDYWKKEYPELFPDQAWTVAGKTNSDADKATIKNITGNGNDLVLTNFGFAENSGYGRYYQYFGKYFTLSNVVGGQWNKINEYVISTTKRSKIDAIDKCYWSTVGVGDRIRLRFKVTGLQENDVLKFGTSFDYPYSYDKDGTYVIDFSVTPATYGFSLQSSLEVDVPTTAVRVEILPFDYEGYLVTDGVDDKIVSLKPLVFGDNFTMIGDWTFINRRSDDCGITKSNQIYVYNNTSGLLVYIKTGAMSNRIDVSSLTAICSNGIAYDKNWEEYKLEKVGIEKPKSSNLYIGSNFNGNKFSAMAFKNLGIYNTILTKDQCIRAYNYLQTIKNN